MKLEFPLTAEPSLEIRPFMRDLSLDLALERTALVKERFLRGDPSTRLWSTSSYSPLCGSRRWRWTLRPRGTWSRIGRRPSPLTR